MRIVKILPFVASLLAGGWAMAAPQNEETAIAVKWYEAFDKNKPEILEAILADGWRDIPDAPDAPPGAQSAKAALKMLHTAFPDFQITVEDVISDGNKVVVRSTISGTHKGSFAGLPASGRKLLSQAVDIHLVEDGKIQQTWHTEDWMSGLTQLGAFKR
ncbi:putative ester cyclase [Rhizobium sp. CF122]|uniref:ester cyclase n=1 Tax=Rhizobium sp. CF122 TaxID=1144312 RepID=UPI000271B12D|nr:ester cyclase [Rhizobium sp. CF122]EJL57895.1 putative ester cyclase [Rhizobium sp. CF122]